jgi:hypothetical protein
VKSGTISCGWVSCVHIEQKKLMVKYGNYMSLDQLMLLYYIQNKDADKNHDVNC